MSDNEHTLEDLLMLLDDEDSERSPIVLEDTYENDVQEFVNVMKVYEGLDKIPNFVIYYTYKSLFNGKSSKIDFFRKFNKLGYTQSRTGKMRYYLLDRSSFDMTDEGKIKAEFFEKEEEIKKR